MESERKTINEPIRVLHVDDYSLDRELVWGVLEKEHGDFHITEAASRAEFEARLADGEYDVVLSDLNILGFDGLQVLDAVRVKDPRVPVVIVTGSGSEEVAVEAMKRGAADYVIKSPKHIRRLPHTIRAVMEKRRLQAEQQRLSAKLRQAQESERKRIARELHDGVAQTLSGLFMHLDLLDNMVESLPPAREYLRQIKTLVEQALEEVRGLVWTLRPTVLDDLGLPDALRGLVANLSQSVPTDIVLHIDENLPPLPSAVETALYRIVQEALSNIFQHARASQVRVHLGTGNEALQLRVADNGQGIGSTDATSQGKPFGSAQDRRGVGLWSMRERAEEVGGRFSLRSSPGQGTTVLVTVPLETREAPS